MPDKVFIDSNILIYAYSIDEPKKQEAVKKVLNMHDIIVISTQTINEFVNVTSRKKMLNNEVIFSAVNEFYAVFLVEIIDKKTIQKAITLAEKHHYSYFDCLMLSSALTNDCSILYSEDMHDSHIIEGSLKIVNPFKGNI